MQDLAQFGSVNSASLTNTTTTTTTIDLAALALEQFITLDDATAAFKTETSEDFASSGSSSSNIPSSLWNLDLKLPSAVSEESQPATSSSGVTPQDVKETLKNRLYSRNSASSVSMDSDVTAACSSATATRALSSPTSSFEEDEADDPLTALEKREKNRVAAQKCRSKKREKEESLQKNVSRLEGRQERLKDEVQKLRDQRESLEDIINVHGMVCPKIRKISNS